MGALAFRVTALAIGAALWSSQALAQASHAHGAGTSEVLGELSFPNSGNGAAQEPFLRGVKLLHNFQYEQAIEAFRAAQKADPTFALAYWGEAMSHNYSLWAEQHVDQAHAALSKLAADPAAPRRTPPETRSTSEKAKASSAPRSRAFPAPAAPLPSPSGRPLAAPPCAARPPRASPARSTSQPARAAASAPSPARHPSPPQRTPPRTHPPRS